MPKGWEAVEDTPFDLQCMKNNSMYFGIFAYKDLDLAEAQSRADIFEIQNEDLMSKRDKVKVVETSEAREVDGKMIRTMLFSGEKDGVKSYYYCALVDFGESADDFAWVVVSAVPSYFEKDRDEVDRILAAAEYTGG